LKERAEKNRALAPIQTPVGTEAVRGNLEVQGHCIVYAAVWVQTIAVAREGKGAMSLPFFKKSSHFVLLEAIFQTKYCC